MSPVALALLSAVPVLLAAAGLVLLARPRYDAGFGTQLALHRTPLHRRVLRRAGRPLLLRLPDAATQRFEGQVATWLRQAGESTRTVEETVELTLGKMIAGLVLGGVLLLLDRPVLAIVAVLVGLLWPATSLRSAAQKRQREIEEAAPAMLELLATLIGAGLTFRHALVRVVERTGGALGDEMRTLLIQMEFGWSPEGALADLTRRCSAPTVVRLAVSARQSIELGAPIVEALQALADDARQQFVVRLRIRAEQLVSRGVAVMYVMALVPFLALLLSVLFTIAAEEFSGLGLGF